MAQTLKEKLYKILVSQLGSGTVLTDETVVINASGITDETNRELVMRLEDEFGVDIIDEEAVKLSTVKDIYEYLKPKEKK